MSDITERLRAFEGSDALGNGDFAVCQQAADEIERLRAALNLAIEWDGYDTESVAAVWLPQALAALGDQP